MSAQIAIAIGTFVVTLALSIASSMFIAGTKFGAIESDLKYLKDAVIEIKAMFRLVPKSTSRRVPPKRRA